MCVCWEYDGRNPHEVQGGKPKGRIGGGKASENKKKSIQKTLSSHLTDEGFLGSG